LVSLFTRVKEKRCAKMTPNQSAAARLGDLACELLFYNVTDFVGSPCQPRPLSSFGDHAINLFIR